MQKAIFYIMMQLLSSQVDVFTVEEREEIEVLADMCAA